MRRLTRYLALALLAWLPLQAAALPGLMLACQLDPAHSSAPTTMHDHGTGHQAHGDDGHVHDGDDAAGGQDGQAGHSMSANHCCHLYSAAATLSSPLTAGAPHGEFLANAPSHVYLFFPEQPKRPPLATL
jgi:hypothetical protein